MLLGHHRNRAARPDKTAPPLFLADFDDAAGVVPVPKEGSFIQADELYAEGDGTARHFLSSAGGVVVNVPEEESRIILTTRSTGGYVYNNNVLDVFTHWIDQQNYNAFLIQKDRIYTYAYVNGAGVSYAHHLYGTEYSYDINTWHDITVAIDGLDVTMAVDEFSFTHQFSTHPTGHHVGFNTPNTTNRFFEFLKVESL